MPLSLVCSASGERDGGREREQMRERERLWILVLLRYDTADERGYL